MEKTSKWFDELEIYFDDLNEEGQKKVLEFFEVESEEEMNFDANFPLFTMAKGDGI